MSPVMQLIPLKYAEKEGGGGEKGCDGSGGGGKLRSVCVCVLINAGRSRLTSELAERGLCCRVIC